MSNEFWLEAVASAVYLSNFSPTRRITPQEAWNGWEPSVNNWKVFGSIGYVHILEQERTKLDDI